MQLEIIIVSEISQSEEQIYVFCDDCQLKMWRKDAQFQIGLSFLAHICPLVEL